VARLPAGVTRLVVVPDGPLHRLAFDPLRLVDGKLVVERFALSHAPSATVFATLRARAPATRTPPPLLVLGDPKQEAAAGLPRLAGASREAKLVARYTAASTVRLGADASASFLRQSDLRPYRILHFATHAVVDERSLAGTALVLSPTREQSGFIGPGDLGALRIDADLVVLSACASAGGTLAGGEGVQGLTSAFLQAGARSLVATGWRVGDRSVVPLVEGFYSGLARGESIVDALRSAKLDAIRAGAPPRTWAAFMAIGDPFAGVPLRAPAKRWWTDLFDGTR
jgi:CHAT domain-containing protein